MFTFMTKGFSSARPDRRAFLAATAAFAAGCGVGPAWANAQVLNVVATTGMIADSAAQIGGDLVQVKGLMGAGVDPHSYRQTRTDIVAMTRADLVLWHGLFLEAQMENFLERLGARQPVVPVTQDIEAQARAGTGPQLVDSPDYPGTFDPHIWMDPGLWTFAVDRIAAAFSDLRPEDGALFEARAAAYNAQLMSLRGFAQDALAQVPRESRVLVTAHDAFSYFGKAFDMEVLGVQGISTESEAGLHRIRTLVDTLVERNIKAVFVESSVSDRNMRALIEGAAAKGHEIHLGGELFSDAMGPAGTYEGTYIGMFDHNVTTIARALGGTAPAGGFNGKLRGAG